MNIKTLVMITCAAVLSAGCMSNSELTQNEGDSIEHRDAKWSINVGQRIMAGFHLWEDSIYFADKKGTVYCVDKNDGSEIFSYKTDARRSATPLVYREKLYFMNGNGLLSVLNAKNGELIKSLQLDKTSGKDKWDYFVSSPVIENDVLYIGAGKKSFYALDADSLDVIWQAETRGAVHSKARVLDSVVLVGDMLGGTYCIDKTSGEIIWQHRAMDSNMGTYAVADDTVYFGSRDTYTYGLTLESGEVKWRKKHGTSWIMATPIVWDSLVITGMSDANEVIAQDAASGEIVWKTKAPYNITCEPIVYEGDKVVFTAGNSYDKIAKGGLFVLDAKTGDMLYRFNTTSAFTDPVLDGNLAYFANEKGEVFCVEIQI